MREKRHMQRVAIVVEHPSVASGPNSTRPLHLRRGLLTIRRRKRLTVMRRLRVGVRVVHRRWRLLFGVLLMLYRMVVLHMMLWLLQLLLRLLLCTGLVVLWGLEELMLLHLMVWVRRVRSLMRQGSKRR